MFIVLVSFWCYINAMRGKVAGVAHTCKVQPLMAATLLHS